MKKAQNLVKQLIMDKARDKNLRGDKNKEAAINEEIKKRNNLINNEKYQTTVKRPLTSKWPPHLPSSASQTISRF
jgi:hypothetical protein